MKPHPTLTAYILAGGKSSRFGSNKARAVLGQSQIPIVVELAERLQSLDLNVILSTNKHESYSDLTWPILVDEFNHLGPIGAIATILKQSPTPFALILTCDMPLVSTTLLKSLIDESKDTDASHFFRINGHIQPFPAVYRKQDHGLFEQSVLDHRLAMKDLVGRLPSIEFLSVDAGNISEDEFFNMNTKEDWRKVESIVTKLNY